MRTILAGIALAFMSGVANAQGAPAMPTWATVDPAPEPNHDALKSVAPMDIEARIRIMQGFVENSAGWVRRHPGAPRPTPVLPAPPPP